MNKVAVIDYGMGNLHSVAKAVEHVGRELDLDVSVSITADAEMIANAARVIFPGVGAIRDCMAEINRLNVGRMVAEAMKTRPVLAICVGMQALMEHSEENGGVDCLGLIPGSVRYFGDDLRDESGARLKVPHMGWNEVRQTMGHPLSQNHGENHGTPTAVGETGGHPLWNGIPDGSRFYFVHSYYVRAGRNELVAGKTTYGKEVVSAVADRNIFATQFHPEKSQAAGLRLLGNFLQWSGAA